jgi:hypothetical protein
MEKLHSWGDSGHEIWRFVFIRCNPPASTPGHSNYLLWSLENMVSPSTFHLPVSSSVSYVKEGKLLKHCIGIAWCYNFNFNHCFKFLQQVVADTNNMKIVECVSQHSMKWFLVVEFLY